MVLPRSRRTLIAVALSFWLPVAHASSVFASSTATVILQDLTWIELRDSVAKGYTTEMRQFSVWLEAERGKGNWASQIDRNKKAGRGRPSKIAVVDPIIRALVQTADWSPDEPASKLADLVRQRLPDDIGGVNDDTVRKAL